MDDISYKVRLQSQIFQDNLLIFMQTYNALAYHVSHANLNHRFKTVSLWSLQMTANAASAALRQIADSAQFREFYATL